MAEVEFGRKVAEGVVVGRRVAKVWCDDDAIVFDGVRPQEVAEALTGRTVNAVCRRGKQLWFELDEGPHPLFHFGMTGAFRARGVEPLKLESTPKGGDAAWPPRFAKIRLTMDDGGELVMTNARRLGRIRLRADPPNEAPISRLGFDPLYDLPPPSRFRELVRRRKVVLKGLLLDQGFAAGVGNWVADEVLYQAGLDPRRKACDLLDAEIDRMRAKLRSVVAKAVAVDARKDRFPKSWLFHHRWNKDPKATTARGERVEHITLAGRTTAWVPDAQS